ncbi:hypothetical protein GG344DRAFT_75999 [Lentinula edodes]|nr:hypothetical protein GG344DRAFT_75999 [Lentinula edodes]
MSDYTGQRRMFITVRSPSILISKRILPLPCGGLSALHSDTRRRWLRRPEGVYSVRACFDISPNGPAKAISNQGAPHLQIRAGPAVPFVDVKFNHVSSGNEDPELYTWKTPPSDVQGRVALALFGDCTDEGILAIRWTNTYLGSDGSFQWRVYSPTNTYQSGYSEKILIPVTNDPSKGPILVDLQYLKKQRQKEPSHKNPKNAFALLQEQERRDKEAKGK